MTWPQWLRSRGASPDAVRLMTVGGDSSTVSALYVLRQYAMLRASTQRYAIDERLKRGTTRVDPKRKPSLWAKIGGVLAPSELRPGRPGQRELMVREYADVRKYQEDVDRLVRAGWEIDQQVDRPEKIVVRWFREPATEGPS